MVTLDEQIDSFNRQLPEIRTTHGASWAVFLDNRVQGAFAEFEKAAVYALKNFADRDFLIRHTFQDTEFAPFMVVEGR